MAARPSSIARARRRRVGAGWCRACGGPCAGSRGTARRRAAPVGRWRRPRATVSLPGGGCARGGCRQWRPRAGCRPEPWPRHSGPGGRAPWRGSRRPRRGWRPPHPRVGAARRRGRWSRATAGRRGSRGWRMLPTPARGGCGIQSRGRRASAPASGAAASRRGDNCRRPRRPSLAACRGRRCAPGHGRSCRGGQRAPRPSAMPRPRPRCAAPGGRPPRRGFSWRATTAGQSLCRRPCMSQGRGLRTRAGPARQSSRRVRRHRPRRHSRRRHGRRAGRLQRRSRPTAASL